MIRNVPFGDGFSFSEPKRCILRRVIWLVILLFPASVIAKVVVYTIDTHIRAAFPKRPRLVGELGKGQQKSRSYQIADDNNIAWGITYQLGKSRLRDQDVPKDLRIWVNGNAMAVDGTVAWYRATTIDGNQGARYLITYNLGNIAVRKYGAILYRDGRFYNWTIQDLIGISIGSAADVFRTYVRYFSVR